MFGRPREGWVFTVSPTLVVAGLSPLAALHCPTSIGGPSVAWVGARYGLGRRLTTSDQRTAKRVLVLQGVLLWALASGCAGRTAQNAALNSAEAAKVVWTYEQVERGAIVSSPCVVGDRVYVGAIRDAGLSTSGAVYCLSRDTGKIVWQFDDDGEMQHMYSSPCLADGRVYIGEGMHANHVCKFYCLDAASGHKLWQFVTEGHIESSPCVADGKVFFAAGDDGLYCLDAVTGAQRWHYQAPIHVDASATVVGKCLYSGSGVSRTRKATTIFCLDADEGKVLWQRTTDLPVWGSPAVSGDEVFFGLGNGRLMRSAEPPEKPAGALLCVAAKTGETRWRYAVSDGVLVRPIADDEHVYFGARNGCCYCLDRFHGRVCWTQDLGSPLVTNSALLDRHLYVVASGGQVSRLEADSGQIKWTFDVAAYSQTKPRLFSSPAVIPDGADARGHHRIYFGAELQMPLNSAAVLYCLRD
jgi:outer membrane protein assembly factor BamB